MPSKQDSHKSMYTEEEFETSQRIAHIGNWLWDVGKDRLISCSREYARIHGVSLNDIHQHMTNLMTKIVHQEDVERLKQIFQDSDDENKGYEIEYRIIRPDGEIRYVVECGEPCRTEDSTVLGQRGTLQDITERKLHDLDRLRSEEELELAQHISNVGSYRMDFRADVMISFSDQMARIYGMSAEEIYAMDDQYLAMAIHDEDRERVIGFYRNARFNEYTGVGETLFDIEYRIFRADGEMRYINERTNVPKVSEGKVTELVGTMQDITERKLAEVELKQLQQDKIRDERLTTLGKMTAIVSHELRNPLGAMRPSLYLLQKNLPTEDKRLIGAFERLDRNINRCDQIIDQMLDFTRIHKIDTQLLDLDDWLAQELDEMEVPDGISVERDFGLNHKMIGFDPSRLRRALINIYDNACQAMLEEVSQGIRTAEMHMLIKTQATEQRIELIVSDSGPGINDEVLPHIFEPLYSTKGFGVGLGLPTVQLTMQQHDGDVEVFAAEPHGTRIIMWLPLTE